MQYRLIPCLLAMGLLLSGCAGGGDGSTTAGPGAAFLTPGSPPPENEVSGTITMQTGANTPSVSLFEGTTFVETASLSSSGGFSFPALQNGSYTVVVSGSGVRPQSDTVDLNADQASSGNYTVSAQGGPPSPTDFQGAAATAYSLTEAVAGIAQLPAVATLALGGHPPQIQGVVFDNGTVTVTAPFGATDTIVLTPGTVHFSATDLNTGAVVTATGTLPSGGGVALAGSASNGWTFNVSISSAGAAQGTFSNSLTGQSVTLSATVNGDGSISNLQASDPINSFTYGNAGTTLSAGGVFNTTIASGGTALAQVECAGSAFFRVENPSSLAQITPQPLTVLFPDNSTLVIPANIPIGSVVGNNVSTVAPFDRTLGLGIQAITNPSLLQL